MTNTITFQNLIDFLETKYPTNLAEDWDQVGIHFGHPDRVIHKVMTTLDVRPEVVDEAIEAGVDTIIVHHPPLFSSIQRFNLIDIDTQMYAKIIKHDINIYAMHTNVDRAIDGMNDWLAAALGLKSIRPVGGYDEVGQPYMPRIGDLDKPKTRQAIVELIKSTFKIKQLVLIEKEPKESYQSIAICGGSGSDFTREVLKEKADVYITGDVTYHDGHDALESGILLIDASHYIEHIFVERMKTRIQDQQMQEGWDIEVIPSLVNTNPFTYA